MDQPESFVPLAIQTRQPCMNSQEVFTQLFLHHTQIKTSGTERGSRSSMGVVQLASSSITKGGLLFSSSSELVAA